jgi:superfamily II DNA or RNA helicase
MGQKIEKEVKKVGKEFYDYQHKAINEIFIRLKEIPKSHNLLFQLPTGGGKTIIFSEIAKRFIEETNKKVLILTHRIELCKQTSAILDEFHVNNKVISSKVKDLPDQDDYMCFVAMVETLNNRLKDEMIEIHDIGLVIIDEAHYNSFTKLFSYLDKSSILGVTATPLSSSIKLPMNTNYDELIVGNSILSLVNKGFLAKASTYGFDVDLKTLKIGINGDYTVSSSDKLYADFHMQEKLLHAYEELSLNKKTLIFNSGINSSKAVYHMFEKAGHPIKHLDSTLNETERQDTLEWFSKTPNAILTSVGILTTGFDEPTIETIILNRATKSLTLYHQMIGRGSRVLPDKKNFTVIDLGNNALRFGLWDSDINWHEIFHSPYKYYQSLASDMELEKQFKYRMPESLKELFPNSTDFEFKIKKEYKECLASGQRPMAAIDHSISFYMDLVYTNAEDIYDAKMLIEELKDAIEYQVKQYTYCICKSSDSYLKWLIEEFKRRLTLQLTKEYNKYLLN